MGGWSSLPRWRPSPATTRMVVAAVVIVGLAAVLYLTAGFWLNWWWFGSVGYRSVLVTRYLTQAGAFLLLGGIAAAVFAASWRYALRAPMVANERVGGGSRLLRLPLWLLTLAVWGAAGWAGAAAWQTWLLWLNGRGFGVADPLFGRDVGFYLFAVPALTLLHRGALALIAVCLVVAVALYVLRSGLGRRDPRTPAFAVRVHVLGLVAALLVLLGLGYLLANYQLLYSTRGAVFGPGYTDAMIERWVNYALALLSVAIAVLVVMQARRSQLRPLLVVVGVWVLAALVFGEALPAVVEETVVQPSQLSRERPYIGYNIAATRAAFDLDRVEGRELSGQGEPPAAALAPDSATFDNIRLWDYRVVREDFQQLRSFVPYYRFLDADVDRYEIDGRRRQVLVAAREVDVAGLAEPAQTWTNRHLAYTHGYGAVVSPVSEATSTGLPVFLAGAIPAEESGPLALTRPEIYFGELDGPWVAVNTREAEISGLSLDDQAPPYAGAARGSIALDSYGRRLMTAVALADRRVLLSGVLTEESKILLRRNIVERVEAIAPFLSYDPDPYPVVVEGRLVWVIDAYTESDRYPGATPRDGVNYIRHSAKATIDAYDGTVTFYRTATADPIADAHGAAFGGLFRPISEAPAALAAHFRYPERLFDVQADTLALYHVTDPDAFYNGEDRWMVGQEQVEGEGPDRRDEPPGRMESYYVTMPLPGEEEPGFGLVLPFTPLNRTNMTAWLAGQTDEAGVPRLVAYRFPPQTNVPGPEQIENRVNTDPVISERITLLDGTGSRVILGNLLVIPVGDTVLYAQPFYLRATSGRASLTEFEYVILATNGQTVMRQSLAEALSALAAGEGTVAGEAAPEAGGVPADAGTAAVSAGDALDAFERGQAALERGDWAAYGEAQTELETILRRIGAEGGATPVAGGAAVVEPATPVPLGGGPVPKGRRGNPAEQDERLSDDHLVSLMGEPARSSHGASRREWERPVALGGGSAATCERRPGHGWRVGEAAGGVRCRDRGGRVHARWDGDVVRADG